MAPTYQFPLSDQQDYKGRITFRAFTDYTNTLSDISVDIYDGVKEAIKNDESFLEQGFNALVAGARGAKQLYDDAMARAYSDQMTGNLYKSNTSNQLPQKTYGESVSLFLPSAIQIADAVEYGNVSLGIPGAAAATAIRQGGGRTYDAAVGLAAQGIRDVESLTDMLMGDASGGAELIALRLIRGASSELAGAVETETGITLNPNRRSNLTGIGIRRFTFAFKLIPNSYEESQEIKKIIKFFRTEMYPSLKAPISASAGLSAALGYPSKFEIEMKYDGKKVATGILPCFLDGFTANYNPSGMAFHKGGDFQEYDIQLSFLEERPLTRDDVLKD